MRKFTKLDVLNDFEEHYGSHPERRAVAVGTDDCLMIDDEGQRCAFSRWVNDDSRLIDEGIISNATGLLNTHSTDILKEEVRHIDDVSFWQELQHLHDMNSNWDQDGLSVHGQRTLNSMKNLI